MSHFHPSLVRHAYKIDPPKHTSYDPYSQRLYYFYKKKVAHILNLSTLLFMGLSTFNGPFIIWNYFINFKSNEFNPPYIMPRVVSKMH